MPLQQVEFGFEDEVERHFATPIDEVVGYTRRKVARIRVPVKTHGGKYYLAPKIGPVMNLSRGFSYQTDRTQLLSRFANLTYWQRFEITMIPPWPMCCLVLLWMLLRQARCKFLHEAVVSSVQAMA